MTDIPASPLFPEFEPFATHMLEVGDGHTLYVEQSGNPDGLPVVVLHGGPGSGCSPKSRQRFDPALYHIICFDQRGAGRSLPHGDLRANTTAHLVADIEMIRELVGVDSWVVYGTRWGCTLALAYAQAHPQRVKGLVVGGVFLGTATEYDWLNNPEGLSRFRPQEYAAVLQFFGGALPAGTTLDKALLDVITGPDAARARRAAELFATYEGSACVLEPDMALMAEMLETDEHLVGHIAVELHYFVNQCFLTPNQLLADAAKLKDIPVMILQGGLDLVCPPATAYALHTALPSSSLQVIALCGHVANDAMEAARVQATSAMATRLGF